MSFTQANGTEKALVTMDLEETILVETNHQEVANWKAGSVA